MKLSTQVKTVYEVDKTRAHDDRPSHKEKYRGTHTEEVLRFKEYNAEFVVGIFVEFVLMFYVMRRL